MIRVIVKRPDESIGHYEDIENRLDVLQDIVGGRIETLTLFTDMTVICDEDGRLNGKGYNCRFLGVPFVGTIMALGVDGDEFTDCPMSLDTWEGCLS